MHIHEVEANLRALLRWLDASEYCVSFPAWGLPTPFAGNFEDHPARTEHVIVVAGNQDYTLQSALNVTRDAQDRISAVVGDGVGKPSCGGLFHGLLQDERSVVTQ
jgi:hypothetical protein